MTATILCLVYVGAGQARHEADIVADAASGYVDAPMAVLENAANDGRSDDLPCMGECVFSATICANSCATLTPQVQVRVRWSTLRPFWRDGFSQGSGRAVDLEPDPPK